VTVPRQSTFRLSVLPSFRPSFRTSEPTPTSVTHTASPSTCPPNIAARPSPGAGVRAVFSISGAHHGRRRPQRPQEVLDREQPEPAHGAAGPAGRERGGSPEAAVGGEGEGEGDENVREDGEARFGVRCWREGRKDGRTEGRKVGKSEAGPAPGADPASFRPSDFPTVCPSLRPTA